MTLKDRFGWAAVWAVAMILVLLVVLRVYRVVHPIPYGERAFIPEFSCHANRYEGEVCQRTGPSPR